MAIPPSKEPREVDEKVCDKGEEWIGSCTWKDFIELFNAEYAPAEEVISPFKYTTLDDLLSRAQVREADLLRKKNKKGKETKRKLEFGDQDTKKPKHDHGRRGGGTQKPRNRVKSVIKLILDSVGHICECCKFGA
ncbi:hypothetical protein Tco_1524416 [Tanacetum coccineum]